MNLPYLLTSIYLLTGTYSYYPVEDVGIVDKIMTLRSYAKGCLMENITISGGCSFFYYIGELLNITVLFENRYFSCIIFVCFSKEQ
jgi:hypothetical protein